MAKTYEDGLRKAMDIAEGELMRCVGNYENQRLHPSMANYHRTKAAGACDVWLAIESHLATMQEKNDADA